jgi:acyl-CoA reductase-like NAD-dependent aldehyde dehydrogenase
MIALNRYPRRVVGLHLIGGVEHSGMGRQLGRTEVPEFTEPHVLTVWQP